MKNIFRSSSLLRLLWLGLILLLNFTNPVSNDNSTKCYRRFKYTLPSWSKCDAERVSDDQTVAFDDKAKMRLPRIDPVKVSEILLRFRSEITDCGSHLNTEVSVD